ncbi:MAG: integration host factor subunit alpha [Pseudomonadota bacterium]|nr:integration host factor subunit alpha [Pseudomonadota bacterium]
MVDIVMRGSSLKRMEAMKFVEDFFEVIIKGLESGEPVKIPGFGNFILRDKKSRNGRNPKTKEEFPIEARRVVSFRTSSILKSAIKDHYKTY